MGYLLFAGFTGRTGRRVALAGAVVAGECLVFLGNGFRCPLTDLAESLGAEHGSVTDLYLPAWFARNMPAIHVPFLLLAVVLYRRNIRPVRHGNPRRRDERRDVLVPFASPAPGEGRLWSFATRR